jgi:hypothetical protein
MRIAEVQFFAVIRHSENDVGVPAALVSLFSEPDPDLLRLSVNTLWLCKYQGDLALQFVDIKCIQAVVAIVPHAPAINGQQAQERFFLVEKPGLDVAVMAGTQENTT